VVFWMFHGMRVYQREGCIFRKASLLFSFAALPWFVPVFEVLPELLATGEKILELVNSGDIFGSFG